MDVLQQELVQLLSWADILWVNWKNIKKIGYVDVKNRLITVFDSSIGFNGEFIGKDLISKLSVDRFYGTISFYWRNCVELIIGKYRNITYCWYTYIQTALYGFISSMNSEPRIYIMNLINLSKWIFMSLKIHRGIVFHCVPTINFY